MESLPRARTDPGSPKHPGTFAAFGMSQSTGLAVPSTKFAVGDGFQPISGLIMLAEMDPHLRSQERVAGGGSSCLSAPAPCSSILQGSAVPGRTLLPQVPAVPHLVAFPPTRPIPYSSAGEPRLCRLQLEGGTRPGEAASAS